MLDIFVSGQKHGAVHDRNPVFITTDADCEKQLLKLKETLSLTEDQAQLFDRCLAATTANTGDDIPFGPAEMLELAQLAMANPDHANEIMACSEHLSMSTDCDGDLPEGIFLTLASAHASLAKAFRQGDEEDSDDYTSSDDE